MPRSYRRRSRRSGYGRRSRRKPNVQTVGYRNVSGMSIGQAARYGAIGYNILKGLINSELKRFDVVVTSTAGNSGVINSLNDIAAGDDAMNRDGNKILAKYLRFQYYVTMNASAVATIFRCMVIVDTENQGVAPSLANILQDATSPANVTSPISVDNTQRFTVLFDDKVTLSTGGGTIRKMDHYKKLEFHISFTGTTSSDRNKNAIYVVLLSNEGTNTPSFSYNSRLAFYDN